MKLKLLFALIVVQLGFAQQRTCGSDQYMQALMADPQMKQQYLDLQQQFESEMQRLTQASKNGQFTNSPNATIRIPVAVHYPSVSNGSTETVKNCLRLLAQRQVNILNADYNATNSDIGLWTAASDFYPGTTIGSMDVSFEIATQNHPAGTGLANGVAAVTFGTDFLTAGNPNCIDGCNRDLTWAGYCNLVVVNISGNTLGFSPVPGSPSAGMTVVIDNNAFGATMPVAPTSCSGYVPSAPYNLGRTLTHELGHFFNLRHTFQSCDGPDCANSGDSVCDTPSTNTPYFNCVGPGEVATNCGTTQLTMNYMDYVQDVCMYMFTAGQATRMTAQYNVIASQLLTNVLGNNDFVSRNFSIAPNPNDGTFAIQLKEQNDKFSVLIIDALGRIVYDNEFNQTVDLVQTIQLDNALNGVYFVTIESNGETLTKKIIVE
ncbi:MAG: zinc-dependent metalloprotease [Bacteroidota bacterium]